MAAVGAHLLSSARAAVPSLLVNEFIYQEADRPLYAQVTEVTGKTAILHTVKDYAHQRHNVWASSRATASRISRSTC